MIKISEDDVFYVCTMIEYVARTTHNRVRDIVNAMTDDNLKHQLKIAEVNHCLSFEQVCDEWIEDYKIKDGTFDNVTACKYTVPSVTAIGRVYQRLIFDVMKEDLIYTIRKVYNSFISDEISDFNSSLYYSNPDYLRCSYEEGIVLS